MIFYFPSILSHFYVIAILKPNYSTAFTRKASEMRSWYGVHMHHHNKRQQNALDGQYKPTK